MFTKKHTRKLKMKFLKNGIKIENYKEGGFIIGQGQGLGQKRTLQDD